MPPRRIIGDLELGNDSNLSNRANPLSGSLFSPMFLSLDIPFFLFPIFFGLTARVIPLRSGLRVFCFHGSSPESMGPSHKADASLRLHAPSLSLVPQRKRGRKKGKRQCPIYMLSGIELRGDSPPTVSLLKHALRLRGHSRGGALRPQQREWPVRRIFRERSRLAGNTSTSAPLTVHVNYFRMHHQHSRV